MYCGHCGASVPDDAVMCQECGAPMEGAARDLHEAEGEMHAVLVAANLARLRGDFEEATGKCIEVLRRYPNNATAHSIIGDIYADQGLLRDAAEWYKLALELEPSNKVDRRKLDTLTRRLAEPVEAEPDAEQGEPEERAPRTMPSAGLNRALGFGMTVVVIVLVAVLAGAVIFRRVTSSDLTEAQSRASKPSLTSTVGAQPSPPPPETPAAASPASPAPGAGALLSAIRVGVEASDSIDAVDYAEVDPRTETALVVFQIKPAGTLADTKQTMLRAALDIARAAAAADPAAKVITLHGKVPLSMEPQSEPQLALVADIDKSSLSSLAAPEPSPAEIAGLMRDAWWHPALRNAAF